MTQAEKGDLMLEVIWDADGDRTTVKKSVKTRADGD